MTYSSRLNEVRGMIRWVRSQAPGVPVYAGLQLWKLPTPDYPHSASWRLPGEGAPGVALFAMAYLKPNLLAALADGPFAEPALPSFSSRRTCRLRRGEPPGVVVPRVSTPGGGGICMAGWVYLHHRGGTC